MDNEEIKDWMKRNNEHLKQWYFGFEHIFGTPLRRWLTVGYGFNVVGFDEYLQTPDGVSTRDHIKERYGQQGLDYVIIAMNWHNDESKIIYDEARARMKVLADAIKLR
jgi:hypothetical protein